MDQAGRTLHSRADIRKALERRIRKELRVECRLDICASYLLIEATTPQGVYLADLLDRIYGGRLRLRTVQGVEPAVSEEHVISPKTLEEDVTERFIAFLGKTRFSTTEIRPLRVASAAEISMAIGQDIIVSPHPLLLSMAKVPGLDFHGFFAALRDVETRDRYPSQERTQK